PLMFARRRRPPVARALRAKRWQQKRGVLLPHRLTMLARRIIPCLDVRDGRTVKGVNFVGLRDAGDPVELAARYAAEGADELVFLDVTATVERRETARDLA